MSQLLPPSLPPSAGKKGAKRKGSKGGRKGERLSLSLSPSVSVSLRSGDNTMDSSDKGGSQQPKTTSSPPPLQPNGGGRGPRGALPPPPPLGAHIRQVRGRGSVHGWGSNGRGRRRGGESSSSSADAGNKGGRKRGIIYSCFRNAERKEGSGKSCCLSLPTQPRSSSVCWAFWVACAIAGAGGREASIEYSGGGVAGWGKCRVCFCSSQ